MAGKPDPSAPEKGQEVKVIDMEQAALSMSWERLTKAKWAAEDEKRKKK